MSIPIFLASHLMFGAVNVLVGQTLQALAAAYMLLSYTQVRRGWTYRLLNTSPVCWVGVLSYSLYLWQQPFFSTPSDFGIRSSPLLVFPANVIAAFCMAVLSYNLVERPMLRLRRALAAKAVPEPRAAEAGITAKALPL
jgi:peptidoglycan/LPS O-acetylase OafA/YrhL